jgi:phosphoribosylanthranilate isomerase
MTIKICGITNAADALAAAALGVHALGFVFWPGSPRAIDVDLAGDIVGVLPPFITPVGVFVDPSRDDVAAAWVRAGIRVVQIHGTAPAGLTRDVTILRAVHLSDDGRGVRPEVPGRAPVLVDTFDATLRGGTGRAIDWSRVAAVAAERPVILAGGLTPDNVCHAIRAAGPSGVDVSSGVERSPGVKDHGKMAGFVAAVRACT